jgi:hypothetical protein
MTALAAHRNVKRRQYGNPKVGATLIATSAIVFEGSLLVADATTGLASVATDAGAGATNFLGICTGFDYATSIPLTGVVGDGVIYAKWESNVEVLLVCAASVTAADNNKAAYCLDDEGVTDATTAGPGCGVFRGQEATLAVWVELGASVLPAAT